MFRKSSLRIRYLVSYLLLLATVVVFITVLYQIYMNTNERYINAASLEKFTYASENICTLLDKLDVSAANADKADALGLADRPDEPQLLESRIPATLANIEDSFSNPSLRTYFYLRGDRNIYSSEGKMPYNSFESAYRSQYDLTMSRLFSRLLSLRSRRLLPILDNAGNPRAIAYAVPFTYSGSLPGGELVFLLSDEMLAEEFTHYLGSLPGDLYVYTSRYELLFRHTEQAGEMIPYSMLIRQRGVGVQRNGHGQVILSVTSSRLGLNFVFVVRSRVFYREMYDSSRLILLLIGLLLVMLSVLFLWLTRANYRPIQRLTADITGREIADIRSDELSLIRSYYHRTVEEAEQLNIQLTELTPLVIEHLTLRMAYGQITSPEVFRSLTRYAGVNLSGNHYAAMCLMVSGDDGSDSLEDIGGLLRSAVLPGMTVMSGEIPDENALCLILNFSSDDAGKDAAALSAARQLSDSLTRQTAAFFRIGVGGAYADPLRMADSYNEASAAVQLAPAESREHVFPYAAGQIDASGVDSLHPLPSMPCSLLVNAVRRGENAEAVRALREILASISGVTESMLYYRFYAVNLSSILLKTAEEENVALSPDQTRPLVSFSSKQEFEQNLITFTDGLCREIGDRHALHDSESKEQLMSYILSHYKDFDLSVQSVAEAVDIRKSQVSAIVRESVGLNFVQYVSYLRMNEFKRLLVETDLPITECVTAIGYQDAPNFLRKFKVVEGVTAGQYRTDHR